MESRLFKPVLSTSINRMQPSAITSTSKAYESTSSGTKVRFPSQQSNPRTSCRAAKSAISPDTTITNHVMALTEKGIRIHAVETLIRYRFHDPAMLWEALQGPAVIFDVAGAPVPQDGNKRLAIVGDAAIRLVLAETWYPGETSKGNFSNIATAVGSNANLDRVGRAIGLERFIYGNHGGKAVADTLEAILGAVFRDSGLKKVEEVMDTLDLVSKARRLQKILESEGFVMFDGNEEEDRPAMRPCKKRRMSDP